MIVKCSLNSSFVIVLAYLAAISLGTVSIFAAFFLFKIEHDATPKTLIIITIQFNYDKQKTILFVGKLNHAKGYHIFTDAALKFKKKNPEWNFIDVGNEDRKSIFPDKKIVTGVLNYGENFDAVIEANNIFGTQFHPEKSQAAGLKILENFSKII